MLKRLLTPFSWVMWLCLISDHCHGLKSHYLHWNTSNPIFRIDNTDHIIDVNHGNQAWEYDQVNIICPLYDLNHPANEVEQYIIYSVSKEEYDSCRITNRQPRVIAQCTQPHQLMYFTITFRSFTPTPGGMEFTPGRDYYFISTSSKGDLHRRIGGTCSSHNMKVKFKVADSRHERPRGLNSPRRGHQGRGRPIPPKTERPEVKSRTPTSKVPSLKSRQGIFAREKLPMHYGDLSVYDPEVHEEDRRYLEYENHPNDIIKHEASRMAASGATCRLVTFSWFLPIFCSGFLTLNTALRRT